MKKSRKPFVLTSVTVMDKKGSVLFIFLFLNLTRVVEMFYLDCYCTPVVKNCQSLYGITSLSQCPYLTDTSYYTATDIRLYDNQLTVIPGYSFQQFTVADYLSLSNNFINSIQDYAFYGMVSLERLYLSDNELTTITRWVWVSIRSLSISVLRHWQIKMLFSYLNTPTFYVLWMNFRNRIFNGVYHPKNVQDHRPQSLRVFKSQIWGLQFYLQTPFLH